MDRQAFLSELAEIIPSERLLTQLAQLIPYESDALTAYSCRPLAVVLPDVQEEVVETVRLCHRYHVPFVARGSGTSLSGGSLPVEGGVVIAMNRLNRILKVDPVDRIAGGGGRTYDPLSVWRKIVHSSLPGLASPWSQTDSLSWSKDCVTNFIGSLKSRACLK